MSSQSLETPETRKDTPAAGPQAVLPERATAGNALVRWDDEGGALVDPQPADVTGLASVEPVEPVSHMTAATPQKPGVEGASAVHMFPEYRAVVTAHFPDGASSLRAQQQLATMTVLDSPRVLQWFEKIALENPWDNPQPGLAEGETALIVHLEDGTLGPDIVRLCEEAGAKHATYYPAQRVTGSIRPR